MHVRSQRLYAVALFVAAAFVAVMITGASRALAQSAPAPAFELADVHVSPPRMVTNAPMAGGGIRQGVYVLRNATMVDLIRTAYDVEPEKVVGGPSWLEVDRFDVVARVPDGTTVKTARLMLRGLLADRFALSVRQEQRDMKAWVLSAPHNGETKLVRAQSPDVAPSCEPEQVPPNFKLICHNVPMDILAERLSRLGRLYAIGSVTNATGLSGGWDFAFTFTPDQKKLGELGADGISLFTALERLGLKLEYTNISATAIVVARVNRTPSANAPGIEAKLPRPPTPEFEVAEFKPTAPGARRRMQMLPNGRLNASAMPLRELIKLAWGFNGDELVAGPKWIDTKQFDLVARVFTGADAQFVDTEFVRLALRKLLVERFQIKFHFEDRPVSAYALRPGTNKMAKADPAARTRCYVGVPPGVKDPREAIPARAGLMTCQNVTMPFFARRLHEIAPGYIEAPIADETGLEGGWNLTLNWSPIDMFPGGVNGFTGGTRPPAAATPDAGAAGPATASTPTGAITLPEAVASQLGIKLEMAKRPMPVLVIDAIAEKPES